jgi:hypothetical protein
MCIWEHCDRPARISVAVGQGTCEASTHGTFCVPHSVLTSRALHESGARVWFDWVRSDSGRPCTCGPLYRSSLAAEYGDGRGRTRDGAPRLVKAVGRR